MKYVLLIHSTPKPWGHPTSEYVAEQKALPQEVRERLGAQFEETLDELQKNGQLLGGEALGAPEASRLYRWADGKPVASAGPYSKTKEHLAGFFLIDVDSPEQAEEVAQSFSGPGETVELRPVM